MQDRTEPGRPRSVSPQPGSRRSYTWVAGAGFMIGLAGLLIPPLWFIDFVLGPLAILFGIAGLILARKLDGRGLAVWSILLGIGDTLIFGLLAVAVFSHLPI